MIHFNNTTGKNKGKVQITKLARFLGKHESTIRSLRKNNPAKFDIIQLGAICKANNINAEALYQIIKEKEELKKRAGDTAQD